MSDYGNYSSEEGSTGEIEFPKTPGQPLEEGRDEADNDEDSDDGSGSGGSSSDESNNGDHHSNNNRDKDRDKDRDKSRESSEEARDDEGGDAEMMSGNERDNDDEQQQQSSSNVVRDNDEDDDDDNDEARQRVLRADNMEEEEEEEREEITRIEAEAPRMKINFKQEDYKSIDYVKLPNFLSIDTHPFDPTTYEDEACEDDRQDDEGRARLKLKVENTIRWRRILDEDGNEVDRESNARIVKWSDGTCSLYLGDEIFHMTKQSQTSDNNHLFIRDQNGWSAQTIFKNKLTFRPSSTDSVTHRKLTLSLADRSQKTQKICVLPSVGIDPDAHRSEMIKKEEDRLKASIRKENQTRRLKERVYTRTGINSSFLEDNDEDDESISISKIKNQYKNGPAQSAVYSSSDSDSSDDDFKVKRHR